MKMILEVDIRTRWSREKTTLFWERYSIWLRIRGERYVGVLTPIVRAMGFLGSNLDYSSTRIICEDGRKLRCIQIGMH